MVPYCTVLIGIVLSCFASVVTAQTDQSAQGKPLTELEQGIRDRQKSIDGIQERIKLYEKTIRTRQQEASTLKNEIELFNDRIARTELQRQSTQQEIDLLAQEITLSGKKLQDIDHDVGEQKAFIAENLRSLSLMDSMSLLETLLTSKQFSEVLGQLHSSEQLNERFVNALDTLQTLQAQVATYKASREDRQERRKAKLIDLEHIGSQLKEQQGEKDAILSKTKSSEASYQSLLSQARTEQRATDAEIRSLEKEVRRKLAEQKSTKGLLGNGQDIRFIWPIPNNGINAGFHDQNYPFRKVFEHPGIDIRTPGENGISTNGHPIHAVASGYVARARDGGSRGYSYVMIIHNDRFSTVYGHLSRIDVQQDTYVAQGQVIGLNGGLPGTPGAGPFSTGPHLHFEVRLDGIPVNPLDYLP